MDAFGRETLDRMIEMPPMEGELPLLSIYLPTYQTGAEIQQNPIRLKNALSAIHDRLKARGLGEPQIKDFLAPVQKLLNDEEFWQHQGEGLAIFHGPQETSFYRLPLDFDEQTFIGERFYIKPLLPMLMGDGRFYLLALSQNGHRFFQGTRHTISEIALHNTPADFQEANRFEDPERQLQFHTAGSSSTGSAASFHGHDPEDKMGDELLLNYFRQVDEAVFDLIKEENAPLLLAAVEHYRPLYAQATRYPHFMAEASINGSPDRVNGQELHQQAWALVEPHFAEALQQARDRYHASNSADDELDKVLKAAIEGRVDTLFVADHAEQWGRYDAESSRLELHDSASENSEGLLDSAIQHTLRNGGTVYVLDRAFMPEKSDLAATFRY